MHYKNMINYKKFPFKEEIENKYNQWIQTPNEEIKESLIDLTGDTYFEMRKLEHSVMLEIEKLILSGKYAGYKDGKQFTEEDLNSLRNGEKVDEELKKTIKKAISSTWATILTKQKVGIDKFFIAIAKEDRHK